MKLYREQIEELLRGAGFPEESINTMAAIALAESAGDPEAHNPVPPDDSYGLWQINMIGRLEFPRLHEFEIHTKRELFVPSINAAAAYIVSRRGTYYNPWSTYLSGAYKKYLK